MTGEELIHRINDVHFLSCEIYHDEVVLTQEQREKISNYLNDYELLLLKLEIESWIV